MYSDMKYVFFLLMLFSMFSCSPYSKIRRIRSGEVGMTLSVSEEKPLEDDIEDEVVIDSIRGILADEPIIMNAIRDSETGEMVATDVINASKQYLTQKSHLSICQNVARKGIQNPSLLL